jgi:hypothetical protein
VAWFGDLKKGQDLWTESNPFSGGTKIEILNERTECAKGEAGDRWG